MFHAQNISANSVPELIGNANGIGIPIRGAADNIQAGRPSEMIASLT